MMVFKCKHVIALIFVLTIGAFPIGAQSSDTPNFIDKIIQEAEGNVSIDIPEDIIQLIFSHPEASNKIKLKPGINKISGWRIQVFSDGRNQHTLEARANARGSAILAKFPKYRGQIYSFSKSPNWYTRVGNFTSLQDATAALAELKRAFPSFAAEMRVVKCQIVVIK